MPTLEESLKISQDFLVFAQEVKAKNAAKKSYREPRDPLENMCKILDRLASLREENKKLRDRVDSLERQNALQRILINSQKFNDRRRRE